MEFLNFEGIEKLRNKNISILIEFLTGVVTKEKIDTAREITECLVGEKEVRGFFTLECEAKTKGKWHFVGHEYLADVNLENWEFILKGKFLISKNKNVENIFNRYDVSDYI